MPPRTAEYGVVMNNVNILLADNNEDFLAICGEFLEQQGFRVITANTSAEAQKHLKTTHLHLAILDLRLTDDDDERDRSGLILAETEARHLPKLILTRFPSYQDVVRALKLDTNRLPPAVNFIDKRGELENLLDIIQETLARHLHINWQLKIQWHGLGSLSQTLNLIEPHLERKLLVDYSAELEDLFRKLFHNDTQITIGEVFAQQPGHVIFPVFAYNPSGTKMYLVSCGRFNVIIAEKTAYKTAVPQRAQTEKIDYSHSAETLHFAATAYTLTGANLEEVVTLHHFFHNRPLPDTVAAIDHLYENELGMWYERDCFQDPSRSLPKFYADWLNISPGDLEPTVWQLRLATICQKALSVGLPLHFNRDSSQLVFRTNGSELSYPTNVLTKLFDEPVTPVQWGTVHGCVNGSTVLVSSQAKTWLVDFTHVARAPLLCDFVMLETAVKFHLLTTTDLLERFRLEQRLLGQKAWGDVVASEGLQTETADSLQLILRIRHWAGKLAGCALPNYREGLLFCTLAFLATYDMQKFYNRRDLVPYVHAALAIGMINRTVETTSPAELPHQAKTSLWIDKNNQVAWVEGKVVDLTIQEFQILTYLYDHVGQLCERQAIVEEALGEPYDEYDPEQSRLNSAMSRLIQKVEPDPKNRKYLTTVRGRGYKLQPQNSLS